ncbi:MAG: hypothetical protein AABY22_27750 [Nanoarchaeota archaeon]
MTTTKCANCGHRLTRGLITTRWYHFTELKGICYDNENNCGCTNPEPEAIK